MIDEIQQSEILSVSGKRMGQEFADSEETIH